MSRRKQKIRVLIEARKQFAGIGTRKAKLVLNKRGRSDVYAKVLRVALEAEDANLTAKRYFGGDCGGWTYAQIAYARKCDNIEALIQIFVAEKWTFGVQPSDVSDTTHIIYFEIPGVGQVSWHYSPRQLLPVYLEKWDGKSGSTLPKLEGAISMLLNPAEAA